MNRFVVKNISELVTLGPLAEDDRITNITDADLGRLANSWLAIDSGKVIANGNAAQSPETFAPYEKWDTLDAKGQLVTPGLVDSHTHILFGGHRAGEFWQRLRGSSYQEIAASGGGIQSTVKGTREASDKELASLAKARLARARNLGITTQEVKSGYGLTVAEEARHLRILKQVANEVPQQLSVTCLALHAKSPDHATLEGYVKDVTENLLPMIAKEGLADWVDAFIEEGYFSVTQVEPYVTRAKELGLGVRLHADEFTDAGAAMAAARWEAASADHMQFAPVEAIEAMAKAGTIATILPGTSLYTGIPYTQARAIADRKVGVAVATDFNPGSCFIHNLAQIIALAALHSGLTPAEAFVGGTLAGAKSLKLSTRKGHLSPGADADFVLYPMTNLEEWFYDFGQTPPSEVWIAGKRT